VTAEFIREAAKRAIDAGYTFYSHTRGRQELRDTLKAYLDRLYGSTSIPTASRSPAPRCWALPYRPRWPSQPAPCPHRRACLAQHRERIPCHGRRGGIRAPAPVRSRLDRGCLRHRRGRQAEHRSIFVNSPCNPTGWVMQPHAQRELLEFCREREILLIADEVYHATSTMAKWAPSSSPASPGTMTQ